MSVLLITISSSKPSGNEIASTDRQAYMYIRVEEKDGNDDGKSNDNAQGHIIGHKPREMDTLKRISKGWLFLFELTVEVSFNHDASYRRFHPFHLAHDTYHCRNI